MKSKSKRRDSSITYKDVSVTLPKHTTSSKMGSTSVYEPLFNSKVKPKSEHKDTIVDQEKVYSCREIISQYKAGLD